MNKILKYIRISKISCFKLLIILFITLLSCGIDQKNFDKIFEPYKRLTYTGTGRGLGLYLARAQVQALKGTLTVESEPGQGSVFHITLPELQAEITAGATNPFGWQIEVGHSHDMSHYARLVLTFCTVR